MIASKNSALNFKEAHKFVAALGVLIASGAPKELLNPREAMLIAVPEGEELELHEQGLARERDLVAIAFRPGAEGEGPTNIAIYERLNNKIRINPRCSAWYRPEPRFFMIASHEDDSGYGYGDTRLLRFGPVPRDYFDLHLELARTELRRVAKIVPAVMPSPLWHH